MMEALARLEPREVVVDHRWTPVALQEEIVNQKALRQVVVEYYRSAMIEGHHFYSLQEGQKPALSKEGALNLCSLFKVKVMLGEPHETFHADAHYSVRYRVDLVSAATGEVMATGDGFCTTRESKYAYRWVYDRDIPSDVEKAKLVKRERTSKAGGGKFYQYKLPNADLADCYNTTLKMSLKRAMVDATLKLPLVSELFTQDLEEQIEGRQVERGGKESTQALPGETISPDSTPAPQMDRSSLLGHILDTMQALIAATPQVEDRRTWQGDLQEACFGTRSWKAVQTKVKPSVLAEGLKRMQALTALQSPAQDPSQAKDDVPDGLVPGSEEAWNALHTRATAAGLLPEGWERMRAQANYAAALSHVEYMERAQELREQAQPQAALEG